MKRLFLCGSLAFLCSVTFAQTEKKFNDTAYLQPVEINAVTATDKTPFAKTDLTKAEIKENNTGQDLPFILAKTPSVIVNSDAGNGIGYTGIRIRGTDATRINVTLNGVPYNDAESLGTFFVDLPDIASSAGSIQVQRGVGTSSNGAGSFGGSINISTNEVNTKRSLELNSTAGSYESFKNTLLFSSGILGKHFTVDARLSNIRTQGYIERAAVRLKSYYLSTAYISDKNSLRLNIFTGKEKTYQAWNGVPEAALDTNRRFNSAGTEKPAQPYSNETDNYTQTHYQLFYNHKFSSRLKSNIAFFLTRGKGYYEQYKAGEDLADYGLPYSGSVTNTDLVRRLWLDNYFYGTIFSLQYDHKKTQLIFGGGANSYDGKHYGDITYTSEIYSVPSGYHFYDNNAKKTDLSAYIKWTQSITDHFQTFVDLQGRSVNYKINGFRYNPSLKVNERYSFFNPKAGFTYRKKNIRTYFSYSRAVKEPNRDDFETGLTQQPSPEKLNDFEAGFEYKTKKVSAGINLYSMNYEDQLVLTGKINDVGAYTRTNVPTSYRNGAELYAAAVFNKYLSASGNITFSRNRIKNFTEFIDDYDNGRQAAIYHGETEISFSPNVISSVSVNIIPFKNSMISLTGKYVGKQFLDNTSNKSRMLHDYYTQDIRGSYKWKMKSETEFNVFLQVNNIFSRMYEPNGYTFSYISGGDLTTENFYFPMAPANFVLGLNIKL